MFREFIDDSSKLSLSQFRVKLKCRGIDFANSGWSGPDFPSTSFSAAIVSPCVVDLWVVLEALELELELVVLVVLVVVIVLIAPFVDCVFSVLLTLVFDPSLAIVGAVIGKEEMDEEDEDDEEGITLRSMSRERFSNSSAVLSLYLSRSCNRQSFVLVAASSMKIVLWLSGAFCGTSRLNSVMRNLVRLHLSIHGG